MENSADQEKISIKVDNEEVIQIIIEGNSREAGEGKINENVIRKEFKQFDFVSLTDNQDKNGITCNSGSNNASSSNSTNQHMDSNGIDRHERFMREWKILEKDLPDSVYVRVLQDNVVRAVFIGGGGLRHGLFFFDITLPPNYPMVPPEVHSYYDGTAFTLKDIETYYEWSRRTKINPLVETWDPNNPLVDVVQVGYKLIKLAEPFERNESVFKNNCGLMMAILRDPPGHFEEFVAQHFRDRAESILIASKVYRIRCGDNRRYAERKEYQDSVFNIYTKLLKAFIKNGSSLDDFVGDINLDDDDSGYVEPYPSECTPLHYVTGCSIVGLILIFLIWCIYELIRTGSTEFPSDL
ncbi:hypothetical protein MKW94_004387 [Papaver nudicaule]|uniref:UBC core domain-containing protein n=1 Tax=Papaver nudicaule TaxID=74823 RepID=A0AA41V1Q5_PAPNU|nr:hypothetical protein [Papaver nudicaule]